MEQIEIFCVDNEKTKVVEVLSKTDKHMKVVFVGTNMTLEMIRKDVNKGYVGRKAGLEFIYNG